MNRLEDFIAYLEEQVANHSIYIWGGQGQGWPTLTEDWIRSKEKGTHQKNALALYRKGVAAGYRDKMRAFDCSGLGMYWLKQVTGLAPSDLTSQGMKGKCTLIEKSALKKGDWVFRTYKTGSKKGRAYHLGYVVDDDLQVIEARGRAYGVQKRPLHASGKGYWNTFGRPSFFAEELWQGEEKPLFTRLLKKGRKGEDVAALQRLLNQKGSLLEVDGIFGSKTYQATRTFQKEQGLKIDGIAGVNTVTALGGRWKG